MNLPITSVTQNSDGSWTFSWAVALASVYRIVLWGVEQDKTLSDNWTFTGQGSGTVPPPIEIVADSDLAVTEIYPPQFVIQWYNEFCDYYNVKQYDGSAWQILGSVIEGGEWVHTYVTPVLTDETSYRFAVTAVSSVGDESLLQEYDVLIVTTPKPPEVVLTYTGPGSHQIQVSII